MLSYSKPGADRPSDGIPASDFGPAYHRFHAILTMIHEVLGGAMSGAVAILPCQGGSAEPDSAMSLSFSVCGV